MSEPSLHRISIRLCCDTTTRSLRHSTKSFCMRACDQQGRCSKLQKGTWHPSLIISLLHLKTIVLASITRPYKKATRVESIYKHFGFENDKHLPKMLWKDDSIPPPRGWKMNQNYSLSRSPEVCAPTTTTLVRHHCCWHVCPQPPNICSLPLTYWIYKQNWNPEKHHKQWKKWYREAQSVLCKSLIPLPHTGNLPLLVPCAAVTIRLHFLLTQANWKAGHLPVCTWAFRSQPDQ